MENRSFKSKPCLICGALGFEVMGETYEPLSFLDAKPYAYSHSHKVGTEAYTSHTQTRSWRFDMALCIPKTKNVRSNRGVYVHFRTKIFIYPRRQFLKRMMK